MLEVAIKACTPARFPVGRCPIIDSGPGAQEAEKDVAGRLDHNAYVAAPCDQISRLRLRNSLEILHAVVQVRRAGVGVGKPCALINGMCEMGAVVGGTKVRSSIKRGSEDREPVISTEGALGFGGNDELRVLRGVRGLILCYRSVRCEGTACQDGALCDSPHRSILVEESHAVEITYVLASRFPSGLSRTGSFDVRASLRVFRRMWNSLLGYPVYNASRHVRRSVSPGRLYVLFRLAGTL